MRRTFHSQNWTIIQKDILCQTPTIKRRSIREENVRHFVNEMIVTIRECLQKLILVDFQS